ncbi:MAG: hypothetical protein WC227_04485 [Patescibacteria group bacterium]|jgi:transcription elongation GreA/GreB family factor
MTTLSVAQVAETGALEAGVIYNYATSAAIKAARLRLANMRDQLAGIIAETDLSDTAHGDVDAGVVNDAIQCGALLTAIDNLDFEISNPNLIIVDWMDHGPEPKVVPGTEITALLDGEEKSWIFLDSLDLTYGEHSPEITSRLITISSTIGEAIFGSSAEDEITILKPIRGQRNRKVKILSIEPWPPRATKKRSNKD